MRRYRNRMRRSAETCRKIYYRFLCYNHIYEVTRSCIMQKKLLAFKTTFRKKQIIRHRKMTLMEVLVVALNKCCHHMYEQRLAMGSMSSEKTSWSKSFAIALSSNILCFPYTTQVTEQFLSIFKHRGSKASLHKYSIYR